MINFSHVSKRYDGGYTALSNVSFQIDKGEMVFLTGHSGAGKTTLLKLMAVIERPSGGKIIIDGRDLTKIKRSRIPYHRRNMGLVFQDHRLLGDRTVFDNVALPLVVSGTERRAMARRVRAALDKVGLLSKEKKYPVTLSAGEQQRVGIARAVVNKPSIVLADEPTGNLDPELSLEIMSLFELFAKVGVTIIIATHDIELIQRMGHRTLTLSAGQMTEGQITL